MPDFPSLEYLGLEPSQPLTCELLATVLANVHEELITEKTRREDLQEAFFSLRNIVAKSINPMIKSMEDRLDALTSSIQEVKSHVSILSQENDVFFGLFEKQTALSDLFSQRSEQIQDISALCQELDHKYSTLSHQLNALSSLSPPPSSTRQPYTSSSEQTPKKVYVPKSQRNADGAAQQPFSTPSALSSPTQRTVIDPAAKKMLGSLVTATMNQRMNPHVINSQSNAHDAIDKNDRPDVLFYSRAQLLTYRPSPQDTAQYINQHDEVPRDFFTTSSIGCNIKVINQGGPEAQSGESNPESNNINNQINLSPSPLLIQHIPRYITLEHADSRGTWTGTPREFFTAPTAHSRDDDDEDNMYPSQPVNIYQRHAEESALKHAFNPHSNDKWSKAEPRQYTQQSHQSRVPSRSQYNHSHRNNYNNRHDDDDDYDDDEGSGDFGAWRSKQAQHQHSSSSRSTQNHIEYDKYGKKIDQPIDKVRALSNYVDKLHEEEERKRIELHKLQSGLGFATKGRFDFDDDDDGNNNNNNNNNNNATGSTDGLEHKDDEEMKRIAAQREKEQKARLQQLWLDNALATIQSMLNKITSAKVEAFAQHISEILVKEDNTVGARHNELQLSSVIHTILNRASKEPSLVKTYAELCYLIINNELVKNVVFESDENGLYSPHLGDKFTLNVRFVILIYSQYLLEGYTKLKSNQLATTHFGDESQDPAPVLTDTPSATIGIRVPITSPQSGRTFCRFLGELYKFAILPSQASKKALECLFSTGDEEDLLAAVDFLSTVLPSAMETHTAKVRYGVVPTLAFPIADYVTKLDHVKNTRIHVITLPNHEDTPISIQIQMRTKFLIMDLIDAFNGKGKKAA